MLGRLEPRSRRTDRRTLRSKTSPTLPPLTAPHSEPVTHPLSRRSLVESYGCSVRSEIMMVAAETAVSPAAAAWCAAEKAAQSGMPGTSVVGVPTVRGVLAECGSVL